MRRIVASAQRAHFAPIITESPRASAWVNRFAVNADYALETSQTALTEVKKIWKNSADTLTLATGWLKDHLTIGAQDLWGVACARSDLPTQTLHCWLCRHRLDLSSSHSRSRTGRGVLPRRPRHRRQPLPRVFLPPWQQAKTRLLLLEAGGCV